MRLTRISLFLGLLILGSFLQACGVKQFNGKYGRAGSGIIAHFPFHASGQSAGADLQTPVGPPCGNAPRPCIRARASIGMPYHFDVNSNATMGRVLAGTDYPAPGTYTVGLPYNSLAGGGKAGDNIGFGNHNIKNRDLAIMRRQASGADYVFP